MAGNAKSATLKSSEENAGIAFEEALKKLEEIVESMETGELPLESLLARFEEGTRLAKVCQDRLEQAELKIKQVEKKTNGDVRAKSIDAAEERS